MWTPTTMRAYAHLHSHWLKGAITLGPRAPRVALTFDDGPDERWTPEVLDILDAHGARATFFVLGEKLERLLEIAREVTSRGHELASHLYSHDGSVADDDARFRNELERTNELISGITGVPPRFLRFPFAYLGRQKPRQISRVFNLETAHWSFSSMDSRFEASKIVGRVERLLFPGAIVLLHDGVGRFSKYVKNRQATVDALPTVLQNCRERGLAPVTLSELLGQSPKGSG